MFFLITIKHSTNIIMPILIYIVIIFLHTKNIASVFMLIFFFIIAISLLLTIIITSPKTLLLYFLLWPLFFSLLSVFYDHNSTVPILESAYRAYWVIYLFIPFFVEHSFSLQFQHWLTESRLTCCPLVCFSRYFSGLVIWTFIDNHTNLILKLK